MYKGTSASVVPIPLHINVSANTNMWMHRFLPLLTILVLARFSSALALDLSPTASPSIAHAPTNDSQNSPALPLNNTSTITDPAYGFNRGFDKPFQRMTILVAALFIAFLFIGFCAHYVTLRSCYTIIQSGANRNNEGLQENVQHAGGAGGGGEEARGLEPWLVRSLPVVTYSAKKEQQEEEGGAGTAGCIVNVKGEKKVQVMKVQECSVCLSEFEEGEQMKVLPVCGHCFHKACIDMWLFSHTTCPICRLSLLKHLKGHTKSLQISTNQSSPNLLSPGLDPLPRSPRPAPYPLPRGPHIAVHLELTMAAAPLDPPSVSTSSGFHAVVVNPYGDVDDGAGDQARNSSAALYPHFPSSA